MSDKNNSDNKESKNNPYSSRLEKDKLNRKLNTTICNTIRNRIKRGIKKFVGDEGPRGTFGTFPYQHNQYNVRIDYEITPRIGAYIDIYNLKNSMHKADNEPVAKIEEISEEVIKPPLMNEPTEVMGNAVDKEGNVSIPSVEGIEEREEISKSGDNPKKEIKSMPNIEIESPEKPIPKLSLIEENVSEKRPRKILTPGDDDYDEFREYKKFRKIKSEMDEKRRLEKEEDRLFDLMLKKRRELAKTSGGMKQVKFEREEPQRREQNPFTSDLSYLQLKHKLENSVYPQQSNTFKLRTSRSSFL